MRAATASVVAILAAAGAGCAVADDDSLDERATSALGGTTDGASAMESGGALGVIDGALWYRRSCPSPDPSTCIREGHFWIDLAVRNDAYAKQVGIVWTDEVRDDPAAPWHTAPALYEGTNADGTETWGIDVTTGIMSGIAPSPHIRFAAFATMAGQTHWANHAGADYELR